MNETLGRCPYHHETTPSQVDFDQIARNAIAAGLFTYNEINIERNSDYASTFGILPVRPLEVPYGNGPKAIRYRTDVSIQAMREVRKNFIKANNLLIPTDKFIRFYKNEIVDGPALLVSDHLVAQVRSYRLHSPIIPAALKDSSLSFNTSTVDRKVSDRCIYTEEEYRQTNRFAHYQPEAVLSILLYNTILEDYLDNLKKSFIDLDISRDDMSGYELFMDVWKTDNFIHALLPSLSIFQWIRVMNTDDTFESPLDQQLFSDAVNFVIENGGLRNTVSVPADVAKDGKSRENKFVCPATGNIREQLLDGSVLHSLYALVREQNKEYIPILQQYVCTIQDRPYYHDDSTNKDF